MITVYKTSPANDGGSGFNKSNRPKGFFECLECLFWSVLELRLSDKADEKKTTQKDALE